MSDVGYLIVNFGGPRNLEEVEPFLIELLTDRDVIRSRLPAFLQTLLFSRIAKKRAVWISKDYEHIGGKSPIFDDTEAVARLVGQLLDAPVLTFHRYLPASHAASLKKIQDLPVKEIRVFPMFPQFCFATSGSIARFFNKLPKAVTEKMRWIKSYAGHPAYISSLNEGIKSFLREKELKEEETALLFSAHGVPKTFIETGDPYEKECQTSYLQSITLLPKVVSLLSYQSQFGRGEWLKPSTLESCLAPSAWSEGRKNVVVVPLTFTSDHLETLFEIEEQYLPPLREQGNRAFRCPALNREDQWIRAIAQILKEGPFTSNHSLIRKK